MKLPPTETSPEVETAAIKALGKTEAYTLKTLQQWGEILEPPLKRSKQTRKSKRGGGTKVNLQEAVLQLINSITSNVDELRKEFQRDGHRN